MDQFSFSYLISDQTTSYLIIGSILSPHLILQQPRPVPCAMHTATLDVSSLAPHSTMMSCTVHSLTDSLMQPSCKVVYILCNLAPRGSPFELSLGLCSNSQVLSSPLLSESLVWWFILGSALSHLRGSGVELETHPLGHPRPFVE